MIDRLVYRCRRDARGDVLALICHAAEWSPRTLAGVLDDLDSKRYRYLIPWETGFVEIVARDCGDRRGERTVEATDPSGLTGGLLSLPRA